MNSTENLFFEIKSQWNFIRISTKNTINYNSEIDYDNNWINCYIEVKGGAFQGKYSAEILTITFEDFKQKLAILYNKLDGKVIFSDLEEYCKIDISGDGSGKLRASIECNDKSGIYSANLTFDIDFDQTFLKDIINQLNQITKAFPIIGDFNISNKYDVL